MVRQFELIQKLKSYDSSVDEELIVRAFDYSMVAHGGQKRASGDLYFSHPFEVAKILADLKLDVASIITGLLHDTVEDTPATLTEIKKIFGDEIAALVDGVTKLTRLELQSEKTKQAENFRKLLLAMSSDIRVLMVKLADRLHNMRTLHFFSDDEKARRIAKETMDIYAPLAERIGMQRLKDELEDLAFSILNPEARESIISRLHYLHDQNDDQVAKVIEELENVLSRHQLDTVVNGREKTPYSIWRKMFSKNIAFEQLSDIIAFRVIVETVPQCYQVLGVVHNEYSVVPGFFKDYISTPKPNNYQSLHTLLIGPFGHKIEIQIRTKEMHTIAELGVAAHWQYKHGKSRDGKQYAWIRGLLDILDQASNPEEFLEHTKLEMFRDQVFCFTPKGDLIALPSGSTSIDFAYAVHSAVGDHAVACKINGKQMPLRTILNNGDQVEIVTSKNQTPSPSWERFIVTGKARARIRRYIRLQQRSQFMELGKNLLFKTFHKEHIPFSDENIQKLLNLHQSTYHCLDDLFSAVGEGGITIRDLMQPLIAQMRVDTGPALKEEEAVAQSIKGPTKTNNAIAIKGLIPGMALHFAGCCHPIPGDRIVGVVVSGRGIRIHTYDCDQIVNFPEPERLLDLEWESNRDDQLFISRLHVTFINKPGSLASMTTAIAKQKGNITNLKIVNRTVDFWELLVDVEVKDQEHLNTIIAGLRAVPIISYVEREK